MSDDVAGESKRRSLVKSLLWRIIGIGWTWIGAYLIILLVPPSRRTAALIATLIVVYHHSTRMVMYYLYERIWNSVAWGRHGPVRPMSWRERILWATVTFAGLFVIFFLILYVTPMIQPKQSANQSVEVTIDGEQAK